MQFGTETNLTSEREEINLARREQENFTDNSDAYFLTYFLIVLGPTSAP